MAKPPIVYKAGDAIESTIPAPSFPKNARWLGSRINGAWTSGEGTLTCFALDQQRKPVLLSCSHVIFPGFVALPDMQIYSPSYSTCCSSGDPIARPVFDRTKPAQPDGGQGLFAGWTGGYKDGKWYGSFNAKSRPMLKQENQLRPCTDADCAIARLDANVHGKNVWPDGTIIKGAPPAGELGAIGGPNFGDTPSAEQLVRVYSARLNKVIWGTLLRRSRAGNTPVEGSTAERMDQLAPQDVSDPDKLLYPYPVFEDGDAVSGTKPLVDAFMILPRPAPGEDYDAHKKLGFDHGDSGAPVINHENRIIAIMVRARELRHPLGKIFKEELIESTRELRTVTKIGHAAPIGFALERLQITIPDDPNGWECVGSAGSSATHVLVPGVRDEPALAAQRAGAERLRAALVASRRGRLLVGKIAQHRRELRRLLATVRAIAAAWRELQGPRFLHHVLQGMSAPSHVIPSSINGVPRARLAEVLLPLLARHGSATLRRDLRRYRPLVVGAVLQVGALDELPGLLARRRPVS